jgi:hypothetical protein
MGPGSDRAEAIAKASSQAYAAGVPHARVDRFINEPAFAKAETRRRVIEGARKASEWGKPKTGFEQFVEKFKEENNGTEPSDKEKGDWYSARAADLRAKGHTGMNGDGGLAGYNQMQADMYYGYDTPSTLSKSKKIAPDYQIINRLSKKVAEGRMSPEAARRKFGEDMLDKMRYDDFRLFRELEEEYQAAVAEAKRTGSPIPERQLPGADIDFAKEAARFSPKQKSTFTRNSGNWITGFGTNLGTKNAKGN